MPKQVVYVTKDNCLVVVNVANGEEKPQSGKTRCWMLSEGAEYGKVDVNELTRLGSYELADP